MVCVATFSGQLYFWRSYFFTLFQSDYFDTTVLFLEQLFFQSSYFFSPFSEQSVFRSDYFFRIAFFQSESSTEQSLIENEKFFMAVTFWNGYFFPVQVNISKKELFFQSRHSINFFQKSYILEKAYFPQKQYSALPTFSGELLFQSDYFL